MVTQGFDPIEMVIFDCDGVLVDSERISNEVLSGVLSEYGVLLNWQDAQAMFIGQSVTEIAITIAKRCGIELPDNWSAAYYERMIPALADRVEPIAGAVDVVHSVRTAGLKYCVASQGPIKKMQATLTRVGLWEVFSESAFSAYFVEKPKPAPDLFLHAAKCMDVRPDDCIVIEDSLPGVSAAKAAGMRVLAYCPHGGGDKMQALGAIPFRSMTDLHGLLQLG